MLKIGFAALVLLGCASRLPPVQCFGFVPSKALPPRIDQPVSNRFFGDIEAELSEMIANKDLEKGYRTEHTNLVKFYESFKKRGPIEASEGDYFDHLLPIATWNTESLQQPVARAAFDLCVAKAINYETNGFDPLVSRKLDRLTSASSREFIETAASRLPDFLDDEVITKSIETALLIALFADSNDLLEHSPLGSSSTSSSARERRSVFFAAIEARRARLPDGGAGLSKLVRIFTAIAAARVGADADGDGDAPSRLDFVCGEAGTSLIGDLLLAHSLLTLRCCSKIVMHCSSFPAARCCTVADVAGHIEHLADPRKSDAWAVRHLGEALRIHVATGQLQLASDPFWAMGHVPLWALPKHIESSIKESTMLIIKGEYNFRRLLGDREWPIDEPIEEVFGEWPLDVCSLRMVRSELAVGLESGSERVVKSWMRDNVGTIQIKRATGLWGPGI